MYDWFGGTSKQSLVGIIVDYVVFVNFLILPVQWNFNNVKCVAVLRDCQIMRADNTL